MDKVEATNFTQDYYKITLAYLKYRTMTKLNGMTNATNVDEIIR